MRVFVVASSPAMRTRLRRLVESAGLCVAGEATAIDEPRRAAAGDVVLVGEEWLLDGLPDDEGDLLAAVAVLAEGDGQAVFDRLRRSRLSGWAVLPADADADQFRAALTAVSVGLTVAPPEAAAAPDGASGVRRTEVTWNGGARRRADDERLEDGEWPGEALTPRERQVLEWLGRGLSNREIADQLDISEHTAKFHVASILAKLGAANRADAVRRGLRLGLVTL